ncbi:hypothetical protein H3L92_10880 [Neisseria dentiae]|nr:hypothetical protein H3L92_10880 [Neisseria dentiae]
MAKLVSKNAEDLEKEFIEKIYDTKHLKYTPEDLAEKIYTLIVSPEEVGDVYEIATYALYQGYEFWIKHESEDTYLLKGNINTALMEKLDFKRVDKYDYEKRVDKKDVELVYEKKELITDFFD